MKKNPSKKIGRVEPIRDLSKIRDIKTLLEAKKNFKYLLLFVLGVNTGLRISDILQLQIGDLWDEHDKPKEEFVLREQKTGKVNKNYINSKIKEAMALYSQAYPHIVQKRENYLFFSTYVFPRGKDHIKRNVVSNFLKAVASDSGRLNLN